MLFTFISPLSTLAPDGKLFFLPRRGDRGLNRKGTGLAGALRDVFTFVHSHSFNHCILTEANFIGG